MTQTTYDIRLRDNAFIPQASLTDFIDADLLPRMNDVGKFTLTVRADSPALPYFVKGGGIIVTRDLGDGAGARYLMSGPFWHLERNGLDNTYILAGPSDEWWLKARVAYPAGGYPFMLAALQPSPIRYYRLGEASGTSATDTSLAKQNGTYTGGFTLGAAGSIPGDPDTAVTLNGTTGHIPIPTSGLPTGNTPWTIWCRAKFAANPAANAFIGGWGNRAAGQDALLFVDTLGRPNASVDGTNATGTALSTGAYHSLSASWDGVNLRVWQDGTNTATATPAGVNVGVTSGAEIGAFMNGGAPSNFFNGQLDEFLIFPTALSSAQQAALHTAATTTHAAYDTRTGVASTILLGYANANLIAPVNTERDLSVLSAAADPSIGSSASANARGDNLLALMQQIASANGDIGFRIVQTGNGALQFQIYQPVDRSASVKFSNDFRNLLEYSYTLDGPVSNSTLVYGGGTAAGRTALVSQDAASIAAWGFIEGPFIDARDTSDTTVMTQRGAADINANSQQTSASFKPIDTATTQFQRDYGLGDIISLVVDGVTITNKVREVHIAVKPPDQELVTLGVGNPGGGIIDTLFDNRKKQQALAAVAAQLNRIAGAV